MEESIQSAPIDKMVTALQIPPEQRDLTWHLDTLDISYELMESKDPAINARGESLFVSLADRAIEALRKVGTLAVWEEVRIWYQARKNFIYEKEGFETIVEWVRSRGESGFWYDGFLPPLDAQTIRAYLRVYEFWSLEWGLKMLELIEIPFGKLRDCLSFARTVEQEDREEFLKLLRERSREEIIAAFQQLKTPESEDPPPPQEAYFGALDPLGKESAMGPEPPSWLTVPPLSQGRRYYLDWNSGRLWVSQSGASGTLIGIVAQFGRQFLTDAQLLVSWLKKGGVPAEVMNQDQIEDALLEFCRGTGIHHD